MRRDVASLAGAAAVLVAVGAVAAVTGLSRNRQPDPDPRLTTYGTGPAGARGFAEALQRLGVAVVRLRTPVTDDTTARTTPLALLDPSSPPTTSEAIALSAAAVHRDLLLVGGGAQPVMHCLGYRLYWPTTRTVAFAGPPADTMEVWQVLRADTTRRVRDVAAGSDRTATSCEVPVASTVDTLLRTTGGEPVILRLGYGEREVTLVSDGALLSNRRVRRPAIGVVALGLVAGRYDTLVVDEFHHGFGAAASASPTQAVFAWSLRSPWGWAGWQLAAVGVLVLLAGGVRFGPLVPLPRPRRRAPLEHVQALATAFGAAGGQHEGVRWIVRGVRRRLGALPGGLDDAAWLRRLRGTLRSARARAAADALLASLDAPARDAPVRAAAAADTLWEELHR